MKILREILICAMLACGCFALLGIGCAGVEFASAFRQIGGTAKQATASVKAIEQAVVPIPAAMEGQMTAFRQDALKLADKQASDIRATIAGTLVDFGITANERIGDSLARVDTALTEVHKLQASIQPVLAGAAQVEVDADKTVVDLHPQLLGMVAANKVAAGQAAETLRDVQRATPAMLAKVQDVVDHADVASDAAAKASAATQLTMEHLAAASKPLPTPLRVFLQVAPGVAGIIGGILESMAATGAFK